MRILVIGGYAPDQLQSMDRYTDILLRTYRNKGHVSLWRPPVSFARVRCLPLFVRKYLAYVDKLFFFPVRLLLFARFFDLIHISDHGYSFYSFCVAPNRTIVTCHDLLSVRGAMGDKSVCISASPIGIWLQRLILAGLKHARFVAFDSQASFSDYLTLSSEQPNQRCRIIPIPLNAPFTTNILLNSLSASEKLLAPSSPYLLMVGSSIPRKNRSLALKVLLNLRNTTSYKLVLAGAGVTDDEDLFIKRYDLQHHVVSIVRPSHLFLNYLYCKAHALLFPSFSEGFGWPLVEAQVCCCPVIASNTTSIPEVAGLGAIYVEPTDDKTFAKYVLELENLEFRNSLIEKGIENSKKYNLVAFESQLSSLISSPS